MTLLTENRNNLPIMTLAPVDGTTPGIRGDVFLSGPGGSTLFWVCTTSSTSKTDGTNSVWAAKNFNTTPV